MKPITIRCVSEALSPITHMSGTVGNEAIISREPVTTNRGLRWLPVLSGNALRNRAVREPGILWLLDRYGLRGTLNLNQLNFLLHGGNLTESTAFENTRRIADMHRLWPLLRLLGGSLPNQILAGSLDVWRGVLVCEENRPAVNGYAPAARLYSSESFVASYQYTRGDGKKTGIASTKETALDEPSNLMIFSGQCVNRGSLFLHGFAVRHASELDLGALLWSLRLWQAAGGTIGGQAARGHGRLRCELIDFDGDQDALCKAYCEYAASVKDEAVAWLTECFAR